MLKRLSYHVTLCLAVFRIVFAPSLTAAPVGAVVQTWHYDAQQKTITLRVVNTSHRDITAYSITVTERFADGTTHIFEHSTDLLEGILANGTGGFLAGTSRDDVIPEPNPIADVVAVLDVVAYDGTADVNNRRAFKNLIGRRKANAIAAQKINDVLTQAPTVEAAKAELSRLNVLLNAKNYPAHSEEESSADTALGIRLQQATSELTQNTDLKSLAKKYGDLAAAIASHSQLVERKEGQ